MKCTYAQTRPRFILSSEGVFGGMEFEPMLTPREKSPLPKMSPEEDRTRDAVDSEPKHYQLSYSGPLFWSLKALLLTPGGLELSLTAIFSVKHTIVASTHAVRNMIITYLQIMKMLISVSVFSGQLSSRMMERTGWERSRPSWLILDLMLRLFPTGVK